MFARLSLALLLSTGGFMCHAQEGSREASGRNEDAVLNYLRPLSKACDKAIRLYYRADCREAKDINADAPVPFPFTEVRPPSKGKTGLAAVREIFEKDKNVRVTEDQGAIRVWIGQLPTEFLQTKLRRLTLPSLARYNHMVAVETLESTEEIQNAARSLGVSLVSGIGGLVAKPQEGLPHLPATMRDVTVDHALDVIASTFRDPVIYGVCTQPTGPEREKSVWID